MTPSRRPMSPRERQSKRSGSSSPYASAHSMLTRTRARYNNRELEPPLVPPLALLPPALSSSTHCDSRISPSHGSFRPSEHSTLELESSLDLLPPIASSTTHILSVIDHHHGDIDSFADAIKSMVLESHKALDRCIRQEISTRDSQIKEERRWAEKNTELAKEQDARMHELELHCEKKELASRQTLEKCQVQLDVLRRRIKDSRSAREQEHRCPICIDLAWNPHFVLWAYVLRKVHQSSQVHRTPIFGNMSMSYLQGSHITEASAISDYSPGR
ncbi:uncharacterized protein C8R40DRAFT_1172487 [Lentinula edodes]|uniref:uncharacterized protein n=1 Tax=Lentinula edodes TaxID=5353 RepID=UPI001E8D6579|nr:uncharacterized protein C8R40DRAFT_1172487 [Lentinula edodes]KAH7873690.1 hypothetical protein C8R40DRAFT_1172487 [Lentinula edodes]